MVKDKIWRKIARINHSINRSAKEKMPSKIFTISHVTRLISSIFTTNLTGMIHPEKLSPGDEIRVISPARSLRLISEEVRSIANQHFSQMGLIKDLEARNIYIQNLYDTLRAIFEPPSQ